MSPASRKILDFSWDFLDMSIAKFRSSIHFPISTLELNHKHRRRKGLNTGTIRIRIPLFQGMFIIVSKAETTSLERLSDFEETTDNVMCVCRRWFSMDYAESHSSVTCSPLIDLTLPSQSHLAATTMVL